MKGKESVRGKGSSNNRLGRRRTVSAYMFLLPFLAAYLIFRFVMLIWGFWISFNSWKITDDMTFVGLDNYKYLIQDSYFISSMGHTLMFVIISTPIFMALSFLIAYLIESRLIKHKGIFRTMIFMPYILPVSIVAIIGRFMFATYTGLINNLINQTIMWLTNPVLVWIAIMLLTYWWTGGYYIVLYIAALQNVPDDLKEAARIDGAGGFQVMWHIVIPYLKPTHYLILFLQMVASFKLYGQAYMLSFGNPNGASRTVIQYIYETAFQKRYMGRGAAAAFILFLIILIFTVPVMRLMNRSSEDQ